MSPYSALMVAAIACGGVTLFATGRSARWLFVPTALTIAALGVWIARWIEVDHLPLFGTHENALSVALATMICGTAFDWRRRTLAVSPATSLIAALLLVQGIRYDAMPYGLTISERSLVVDVHAVLAWLAFGVFAVSGALAVHLVFRKASEVTMEPYLERVLTLGFVLHTAMIATGSLYKFMLFGKVWSWDPIETMAIIAWLAYGMLLHMSLLAGWSSRRMARWAVGAFAVLAVSYRAIIWFPSFTTYHIFDIGMKLHLQ